MTTKKFSQSLGQEFYTKSVARICISATLFHVHCYRQKIFHYLLSWAIYFYVYKTNVNNLKLNFSNYMYSIFNLLVLPIKKYVGIIVPNMPVFFISCMSSKLFIWYLWIQVGCRILRFNIREISYAWLAAARKTKIRKIKEINGS
jgi:hypothetical protein